MSPNTPLPYTPAAHIKPISREQFVSKAKNTKPKGPSTLHLVKTAFAAAVGVNSEKNRQEDFAQSSIVPYIIAGVIFTACFILTLVIIVSLVV